MKTEALEATEAYSAARATAPRVSLDSMKARIFNTHFFLAGAAIAHASPNTPTLDHSGLDVLTICVLELENGWVIIGKSAPASKEKLDEEKGRVFAYEDAIRQLWPLEGYLLCDRLWQAGRGDIVQSPSTVDDQPHPTLQQQLFAIPPSQSDMAAFIGTKGLYAKPMTRGEYNQLRGWKAPKGEDQSVDGYLVEYADGKGGGDVEGFAGYVSWSPKDVFDAAYHPDVAP